LLERSREERESDSKESVEIGREDFQDDLALGLSVGLAGHSHGTSAMEAFY
jgi:hypothetical protein